MLGQFDLVGIPPAPRGVPQVEVTFDIDANGIVNVSAKDKATNKEQAIRIQASGGLSDQEIERMVKDAESHAAEDKKRRELVEARNQAEALIHSTERSLQEHGDKIDGADKTAIETDLQALREAVGGEDPAAIQSRTEALARSSMKLGEAMYRGMEGGDAGAGAEAPGGATDDGGVVDAEFEEVRDDKKDAG
jgi:molecular chaperone DnaK